MTTWTSSILWGQLLANYCALFSGVNISLLFHASYNLVFIPVHLMEQSSLLEFTN